ncbi:MAG: mechanosensitive ion channel domain-containing protein [Actinomycetota bacterium]
MPVTLLADITVQDWVTAASIAAGTLLVSVLVRRLTKRRIRKVDTHAELIDAAGRLLIVVIISLGGFYTLRALGVAIGPLVGALGVGALFVAVGLQPLLVNVVGSVIIQARRPFRRGDQIRSSDFEGTVIDITSTSTVLLSYNGEAIHIPNAAILSDPLINWTHEPVRRSILSITVPYGSDMPLVLRTLGRAARDVLADENLPPAEAIAIGFGHHGVETELRYWHYSDELESRVAQSQVTVAAERALRSIDVTIPYPQVVVHPAPAANPSETPETDGG